MLVEGVRTLLKNDADVTAICNGNVRAIPAPENSYPCVTFQTVSAAMTYTLTDPTSTGITKSRIVFNCIAEDYGNAVTLAHAVKNVLSGYRGTLPEGTRVLFTEIVNMVDGNEDESRLSTTAVHAMFTYIDQA